MKSSALKAAIVGAVALAVATSLPAPAFAINKTTKNCKISNPDGLLYMESERGRYLHCFANSGTMGGLAIYAVRYIDAGYNRATIWFYRYVNSPTKSSMTLGPGRIFSVADQDAIHAVTDVEIQRPDGFEDY